MKTSDEQQRIVSARDFADWWSNPQEVIAFARILVDAEQLGGCQHSVILFFEAPWDWNDEHQLWCDAGRPHNGSSPEIFASLCARFDAEIDDDHVDEYTSASDGGLGHLPSPVADS